MQPDLFSLPVLLFQFVYTITAEIDCYAKTIGMFLGTRVLDGICGVYVIEQGVAMIWYYVASHEVPEIGWELVPVCYATKPH